MTSNPSALVTEQVLRRICSEYIEMPGLRLTIGQARRLWDLDEQTCIQVMQTLVEVRFLRRTGVETVRAPHGRGSDGPDLSNGRGAVQEERRGVELVKSPMCRRPCT